MPLSDFEEVLLAKIESAYATDPTPTGAANAILYRNLSLTPLEQVTVPRNVVRAYMGHSDELIAANYGRLSFEVEVAGHGTAGSAPPWGPLMRACAMGETLLGSAHSGTAAAGASGTITLAAGASAVDDAYNGLAIKTTGGTGSGQRRLVVDYNGTTKVATVNSAWTVTPDNTTTYSLDAQACYAPVTATHESITIYAYMDGVLHEFNGCRGTWAAGLSKLGDPVITFQFTGLYVAVIDSANAVPTLTGWQTPLPVNNTNTTAFTIHGYAGVLDNLQISVNNNVVYRHLVGSETVRITNRAPTGSVLIEAQLVATFDVWTKARAGTLAPITIKHGTSNGNIVYFDGTNVQMTRPGYQSQDDLKMTPIQLLFKPGSGGSGGNDEIFVTAA